MHHAAGRGQVALQHAEKHYPLSATAPFHVNSARAGIQVIPILGYAFACALVLILCTGARSNATAQVISLRYGQAISAAKSIFSLPIFVGEREGFFSRAGLNFKIIIPIPGGSDKMIDALHDDTVDVTHVAVPFLIRAALNGSDAVAIAAEFTNPIYSLVAKPEIKSFADLKGKLLGLADEAGTITISTRKLLAMHGVGAKDVRVKIIEGTPTRWNCLKRGECDAVPLGQPQDLIARKEGFRVLGISNDAVPDFLYTVTAVRKSWAEKNRDAVVRYLRGLSAAFKFIRDPANRQAVIKTIVETNATPADIAQQTLAFYFEPERGVLPKQGEINVKGLSQVISFMGEAGLLKQPLPAAERFVELKYLPMAGVK